MTVKIEAESPIEFIQLVIELARFGMEARGPQRTGKVIAGLTKDIEDLTERIADLEETRVPPDLGDKVEACLDACRGLGAKTDRMDVEKTDAARRFSDLVTRVSKLEAFQRDRITEFLNRVHNLEHAVRQLKTEPPFDAEADDEDERMCPNCKQLDCICCTEQVDEMCDECNRFPEECVCKSSGTDPDLDSSCGP